MKKLLLLIFILVCGTNPEPAQPQLHLSPDALHPSEVGLPFIRNYPPKEYGADIQNWAIVQDDRGVMYFGNNLGLLEYDGVSWRSRFAGLPNKNVVRSLAKNERGRIYVGGIGDFGYLQPDARGRMEFVSLLPFVPETNRDFADVWNIYAAKEGVYFATTTHLFRWSEETRQMKMWKPASDFHQSAWVESGFYIRQWDVGLLKLVGNSLQLVPGGERFANERIYVMLPFPAEKVIAIPPGREKQSVDNTQKIASLKSARNDSKILIKTDRTRHGIGPVDQPRHHRVATSRRNQSGDGGREVYGVCGAVAGCVASRA